MSSDRIDEFAKELNKTSNKLLKICSALGIKIKNPSERVTPAQKKRILAYIKEEEKKKDETAKKSKENKIKNGALKKVATKKKIEKAEKDKSKKRSQKAIKTSKVAEEVPAVEIELDKPDETEKKEKYIYKVKKIFYSIVTRISSIGKKKKIIYSIVAGILSILFIIAAVLAVNAYIEYKKAREKVNLMLSAKRDYETGNFEDITYNYIKAPEKKEITPGQTISFLIGYKNTGPLDVQDLSIELNIPEHLNLTEEPVKEHGFEDRKSSLLVKIGDVASGQEGSFTVDFSVDDPLDNGTVIVVPEARFLFVKEALQIGKKDSFNNTFSSDERLSVVSSPDFSSSSILIAETTGQNTDGKNIVSYGDSIKYAIGILNNGNMDAANIEVLIEGLEGLDIIPEDNPDFQISDLKASLQIKKLEAGDSETFYLDVSVNDSTENNSSIRPSFKITYEKKDLGFDAPESIVKLYPSFTDSSISIAAKGGGVYSGDVVDVTVSIKNTGNIKASNVIARLVISNLFMLDQGQLEYNITELGIGEAATFQASLKIADGIIKDTNVGCYLQVSSDEIGQIQTGDSSILVSGEKPFTSGLIPIVALHGIEPTPVGYYEISTGAFDYLLGTLKSMGYKTITFMDLLAYLDSGKKLPEKPVIITSDDGYYSVYASAFPILKKYGFKMTVFLPTGLIGNSNEDRHINDFDHGRPGLPERPMLIWPEVVAMSNYGIEFQSHTVNHARIADLSAGEDRYELAQSKADIESHLGKPCVFVAWPFDSYSNLAVSMLSDIGYRGAVRYKGGVENLNSFYIYGIKRVPLYSVIAPEAYAQVLQLH